MVFCHGRKRLPWRVGPAITSREDRNELKPDDAATAESLKGSNSQDSSIANSGYGTNRARAGTNRAMAGTNQAWAGTNRRREPDRDAASTPFPAPRLAWPGAALRSTITPNPSVSNVYEAGCRRWNGSVAIDAGSQA